MNRESERCRAKHQPFTGQQMVRKAKLVQNRAELGRLSRRDVAAEDVVHHRQGEFLTLQRLYHPGQLSRLRLFPARLTASRRVKQPARQLHGMIGNVHAFIIAASRV